jgi:hypothetical protein
MAPANFRTELLPIEGLKSKDPMREKASPTQKPALTLNISSADIF